MDNGAGDLLERLLRRGRLPLGVIDTRPARARVARWLAWQQRHDALSARLLARGVMAEEQASAPAAPQLPGGLSAWVMPPVAAPVVALPLPDAPRARPSERESAAGPRLRIRRAPLSAALPPPAVKAQPPAPMSPQPAARDGESALPPTRAQTLATTVHAAPALPVTVAAQRPVAAGSSQASTPATLSPGTAQPMPPAPVVPPVANPAPALVQPLRTPESTPQRALPLVAERFDSARDASPRVVALPLRATAHTALVPSAQPASPALVSVPTAPAAAAPRAGAELPQQAAKEPPLQALVERVSRLVLRRLEIEFERRGGRPWR